MNLSQIKVFISYAWEPDPFRHSIAQLAGWIEKESQGKVKVTTDYLFTNRAPKEGWPIWMINQIEESDVVLIVCSPLYNLRFRKKETDPSKGKGVIYEGTIITQEIFNSQAFNEKFFPILPDGGQIENIPTILQPYFNGHSFPNGNDGILKLILNENPTYDDLIKPFFEAPSVSSVVKETLAGSFQKEIKLEIEKEILKIFTEPQIKKESSMLSPLQTTVRAFLTLSEIDKINVIKDIGIDTSELNTDNIIERDKQVFKVISDKKILSQLWDALHKIKSFGINNNPFIKS